MRAGWFRARFSGETDDPAAPERDLVAGEEPADPLESADPLEPDGGEGPAPDSPDAPSTPASLVRPGFGHPTF